MAVRSKNQFLFLQRAVMRLRIFLWNRFWGMQVHPTAKLSLSAKLDKTHPAGIHIHEYSYVTFRCSILSHDRVRRMRRNTVIERNCFIGAHSIILPGVRVGEGSIVAAGSVVTKDVPPRSIVAGNPARVIRSDVVTGPYGTLIELAPSMAGEPPAQA